VCQRVTIGVAQGGVEHIPLAIAIPGFTTRTVANPPIDGFVTLKNDSPFYGDFAQRPVHLPMNFPVISWT
jgi:hypothetical protein